MNPASRPFSVATRVAGSVLAVGYLLGFAPGSIVAVVAALGLVTFGRALVTEPAAGVLSASALALLAFAVVVAGLRWETLDLAVIRDAQAVLSPTVLLGPPRVSLGAWVAAAGGGLALAAWLMPGMPADTPRRAWWGFEGSLAALALVSVYWGPALAPDARGPAEVAGELARWALTVAAVVAATGALAFVAGRLSWRWRIGGMGAVAATLLAAAALVLTTA